jgi:glycosyltransferase involved in cell wall biosynthesis
VQISATIITLNEERNLGRAIESVETVANEIIVVDSGSTDRTRAIAESIGACFLTREFDNYANQKNFAAACASHDWILSLDADEALSPALAAEIQELKRKGPGTAAGFTMPRMAQFQGRWIRHSGWYPDRKLRLYDRRRGYWVGDYVHEHVDVDGPIEVLKGDLRHYPADSWDEQLRSIDRYTTLAARQVLDERAVSGQPLSRAEILFKLALLPGWKFVETYVVRQGFRDGASGLQIARLAGYYVCRKYEKLLQMTAERKSGRPVSR